MTLKLLDGPPMGRKSTRGEGGPKRKPGPEPTGRKPTVGAIKGSPEYGDWLERGAKFCLLNVSTLLDIAVTEYLKGRGFPEERPER